MHPGVAAVVAAGAGRGVSVEPDEHAAGSRTAADAAAAIGCPLGAIVESLVFRVDDEVVVALVSGANSLDEAALAAVAGGREAGRVDLDAVRARATPETVLWFSPHRIGRPAARERTDTSSGHRRRGHPAGGP